MLLSISRASKSRIAFSYSVLFSRLKVSVRPGFGLVIASASKELSSQWTIAARSSWGGDGIPTGGITPVRNFRMTFSRTSGYAAALATSMLSNLSPAVSNASL